MRELKGQDRLCSTVYVGAARGDPVTATPRRNIGQRRAPVIGAEEPAPCRLGVREPAGILRRREGGPRSLDGGLRFQRLLVERQGVRMCVVEALAADRAEMPAGGNLVLGDPLQCFQP